MMYLFYPLFSQVNLVPNGGFENYSSCPTGAGAIDMINNWFQPNKAGNSSDSYNACNGDIPYAGSYYQNPKSGNGYSAIALLFDTTSNNIDKWREYIEVKLTSSLIVNRKYCIRFYTNKGNWSMWAVKNIQAVLTNDSLLYNDPNYNYITGVTPVVEALAIIYDTLNWVPIETTYTANGGERFLTIGNFSSGASTIYQQVLPYSSVPNTLGYYAFDDVSIYEQPEIFAGNDTVLSLGDSAQLGLTGRPDIFYNWAPTTGLSDPNIANPIASPGTTTTYTLTVTDTNELACTNTFIDTVKIQVGSSGINEQQNNFSLRVFPNPFGEKITFQTNVTGQYEIGIFDIVGKQLLKTFFEGNEFILKDAELKRGIYFYEIRNKKGDNMKGKFLKK
jgi:hypothetical protein